MAQEIALALLSGLAGGTAALGGQFIAQRAAAMRHAAELELRSEELLASFALPVAAKRAEALEELFDIVQEAIENKTITLVTYERTRRLLIYAPRVIGDELVTGLSELLRASRSSNKQRIADATESLREVQAGLRSAAGLESIDQYVDRLHTLRAEVAQE